MGYRKILALLAVAHNQVIDYFAVQLFPGGHSGLPFAVAGGTVAHIVSRAAASSSNVFFTANSLVEVGISP
jgi:hypothetical protein